MVIFTGVPLLCNMNLFQNACRPEENSYHTLRTLQESLGNFLEEGVFRCSKEGRLVFSNGPFIKMFGFMSAEELQGVEWSRFFDDDEALVYLMDRFRSEGIVLKHRILCRRRDGTNFWGEVSGSRSTRDSDDFYEGMIKDISDQIEAEQKLRQKEEQLNKLTIELDRFIYSASHEIRSPVTTLLGIVNLMKHELKDVQGRQYITMIETCIDKLDQIVRQLTAHVRNYKNRIDDKCIDFDLIIQDVLNEFSRSHASFAHVTSSYDVDISPVFHSDPDRLRLILYNVIKNSFDYMDKNKSIRVLSVSVRRKQERAIIDIFDNGIGIAAMHIERVFDMFYRATHLTKGSGIGLYTVREMVTKLGGTIALFSEYGVGTSVKIELPNSHKGKLINKKQLLRSVRR